MLVSHDSDLSEVIIEITHTQGVTKDSEKLKKLMQVIGLAKDSCMTTNENSGINLGSAAPMPANHHRFAMPSGRI